MASIVGVRVIHSKIHGYGGVALRAFARGELVCHGDGVLYQEHADFDDTYALVLDGHGPAGHTELVFLDLVDQTRWFNHSCDPNTEVSASWDPERATMDPYWTALRDIRMGEEITYDYAFVADVAEPCHCGAYNCRGLIVDDDPANVAQLPEHLRVLLRAAS
jgi:hypothetical protein